MNIVKALPPINLSTAYVTTEAAQNDAQKRTLIQESRPTETFSAEARLASEADKAKQPGQSVIENQQALSQEYSDEQKIEEKPEHQEQSQDADENGEQQNSEQPDADQQEKDQQTAQEQRQEEQEAKELDELKARDHEVRTHENAHAAVGGQYAGTPSYEFERGSDGNNYAVAGEVPIDISEVAGDPQATIDKMEQVQRAALAPAEPSSADRAIAAEAGQKIAAAQAELTNQISKPDSAEAKHDDKNDHQDSSLTNSHSSSQTSSLKQPATEPEVAARAERIYNFYHAATSPDMPASFSQQA